MKRIGAIMKRCGMLFIVAAVLALTIIPSSAYAWRRGRIFPFVPIIGVPPIPLVTVGPPIPGPYYGPGYYGPGYYGPHHHYRHYRHWR
jgi:hypothetical protein